MDDPTSFIDQVKNLLDDAIVELPYWCANGAEVGGRVVGGRCNFFVEVDQTSIPHATIPT